MRKETYYLTITGYREVEEDEFILEDECEHYEEDPLVFESKEEYESAVQNMIRLARG